MVADHDFSHGADFSARISAVGFDWSSVGENIATGFTTPAAVVQGVDGQHRSLPEHPQPHLPLCRHRRQDRAIAGYSTRAGTWTQDFGLLMGQPAASGNWGPANGCPY